MILHLVDIIFSICFDNVCLQRSFRGLPIHVIAVYLAIHTPVHALITPKFVNVAAIVCLPNDVSMNKFMHNKHYSMHHLNAMAHSRVYFRISDLSEINIFYNFYGWRGQFTIALFIYILEMYLNEIQWILFIHPFNYLFIHFVNIKLNASWTFDN